MSISVVFDVPDLNNDSSDVIETKSAQLFEDLNQWSIEANALALNLSLNSTNATSSTAWTISNTGSQTFNIPAGKSFDVGMTVKVASNASPQNWGLGDVTAVTSTSVTVAFRNDNGSGTFSDWTITQNAEISTRWVTRSARTGNTKIQSADLAKFIDITSGTFTQTFDAAADLGDGFNVTIRNSGAGDITLNPDGSETIDSLASFIMYPGEVRKIFCDGSALYSVVLNPFYRRVTSTYASMPIPPGYTRFGVRAWSGGASGQRTNNASTLSRGGAGGGCVEVTLASADFGDTETVTIGAGGAAVTTVADGNVGGDTSFGSLLSVYAGNTWNVGGSAIDGLISAQSQNNEAVYAGASTSAAAALPGIWGGSCNSANATQNAANALFGGAAGGSLDGSATLRAPGSSTFGGDGGAASSASNGVDGAQPGGGGGATQTGTQSGAGGAGQVDFWGIV